MKETLTSAIILDILALLLVGLCIWSGYRKGVLRTVAQVAAYIAVLGLSAYGSGLLAPVIYEKAVEPALIRQLQQQISTIDLQSFLSPTSKKSERSVIMEHGYLYMNNLSHSGSLSIDVSTVFQSNILASAGNIAEQTANGVGHSQEIQYITDGFATDGFATGGFATGASPWQEQTNRQILLSGISIVPQDLTALLSEYLQNIDLNSLTNAPLVENAQKLFVDMLSQSVRPVAVAAIGAICFVILFGTLSIAVNILLRLLGVIHHVPVLGRVNRLLGACLGFLQGCLLVWLTSVLLGGAVSLFGGRWWMFSADSLQEGFIFPLLSQPFQLLSSLPFFQA